MKTLTIFTPTYNRAYILPKLYESLCKQTSMDFLWLIVDDGSTDNTKLLVDKWKANNKLDIQYYYQSNKGKMQAHNLGVENTNTELFLCVDSDDTLEMFSVETIVSFWNSIKKVDNICGIIGPRKMLNSKYDAQSLIPNNLHFSTMANLYRTGFRGETAIVFITKILKQYKFPQIKDEKFIPEDYIYCQLDDRYVYAILRSYTIDCDYRDDGYTKNSAKIMVNNPKGFLLYYQEKIKRAVSLKEIKYTIVFYIAFSLLNDFSIRKLFVNSSKPFFTLLFFPWGFAKWYKLKIKL